MCNYYWQKQLINNYLNRKENCFLYLTKEMLPVGLLYLQYEASPENKSSHWEMSLSLKHRRCKKYKGCAKVVTKGERWTGRDILVPRSSIILVKWSKLWERQWGREWASSPLTRPPCCAHDYHMSLLHSCCTSYWSKTKVVCKNQTILQQR